MVHHLQSLEEGVVATTTVVALMVIEEALGAEATFLEEEVVLAIEVSETVAVGLVGVVLEEEVGDSMAGVVSIGVDIECLIKLIWPYTCVRIFLRNFVSVELMCCNSIY